jgi:GNAT superfamily N-acetyltransferase
MTEAKCYNASIMPDPEVTVRELTEYSDEVATGIGRLLPILSANFSGEPVSRERLNRILNSSMHAQLIAEREGQVVGIATMSIILEPGFDKRGYLGAFVVDPDIQRAGIGSQIWKAILQWCRDQSIPSFEFKTEESRQDAIHFYEKRGAVRRDGTYLYKVTVE